MEDRLDIILRLLDEAGYPDFASTLCEELVYLRAEIRSLAGRLAQLVDAVEDSGD